MPDLFAEPEVEAPTPEPTETPDDQPDVAVLQKRLKDKDTFIEQLKAEQKRAREDLDIQARLEQLQALLKSPSTPEATPPAEPDSRPPLDEAAIEKMLDQMVVKKTTAAKQEENTAKVVKVLLEKFGPGYKTKLQEQMAKFGLSEEDVRNLAARSPEAALKLVDVDTPRPADPTPPRGAFNSESLPTTTGDKGWKDYEKMRRSADPKVRSQYWSPEIQNQIHKKTAEYMDKGLDFSKT